MTSSATPQWVSSYPPGLSAQLAVDATSLVDAWRRRVEASPDRSAIAYFDGTMSARRLDGLSDAFAAALQDRGVTHGDRIGILMQNVPQYAISFLVISGFFIDISTPGTLGLWTFFAAGLLNMFVPSGGGQFTVMAPLFAEPARALGVDQSVVIMAISYGDQWTNMIQPFWAIPLLAVAGLKVRDILGYTFITLLLSGIIFAGVLLIIGAG